jgi:hypothetical protein
LDHQKNTEMKKETPNEDSVTVVRSDLPCQIEIPPVWGNSSHTVDAAAEADLHVQVCGTMRCAHLRKMRDEVLMMRRGHWSSFVS